MAYGSDRDGRGIGVPLAEPQRSTQLVSSLPTGYPGEPVASTVDLIGGLFTGTVVVAAKGSLAAGVWPAMDVYVNDVKATVAPISVETDTWETYTVEAESFVGGDNSVDVVSVNDLSQDPEVRNLFVQSVYRR